MLDPLRDRGHDVAAFDLPGRGADAARAGEVTLDDHVRRISEAVDQAAGPAILVGHSMGGLWCSQLAERRPDAIARIVYLSAVVAPDGQAAFPDLASGHDSALQAEGAFLPSPQDGTFTISPEVAPAVFYGRCSAADAAAATARLCPEPLLPLMTPLALGDGFASVDKVYIGGSEDRVVPPPFQRHVAEIAGARLQTIDSDHSPFYSATATLVDMLDQLA